MSERFLKFIPSPAAIKFAIQYKNAFVLLMIIAERARRFNGDPDGLTIGQCHLGSHKNYGMTEKEYRYAKKVLVDQGLIKIVVTNRTRKKAEQTKKLFESTFGATVGATELTTTGTIVELLNSSVWDINSDDGNQDKGDRKGDRGATEGRLKGDKQERIRKKKKEKEELTPTPSLPIPSKIKFRELVELTQAEYDSLLAKNGQEFLNLMLDVLNAYKGSSGKKYDSDFHTMNQGGWVVNRVKKDLQEQKLANEKPIKPAQGKTPPGNTPGSETKFNPQRVLRGGGDEPVERPVSKGSVDE